MDICRLFIVALFLSASTLSVAQNSMESDHELWSGFSFNYKLNKKISFSLEQQVRMNENFSNLRSNFFEFGGRYKWNKRFYTKLQYRYTLRTDLRNIGRYSVDLGYQQKIKKAKLKFSYRARFQHSTVEFTMQPATYLRNRVKLSYYDWKKITPYTSFENFYKFNKHKEFRGNRFIVGMEVSLGKQLDLKAFYGMDFEINTSSPQRRNLWGALFTYDL